MLAQVAQEFFGDQYRDSGWVGIVFTYLVVGFVLLNISRSHKRGGNLFIRRIAGLNAIDEAIGRATEMGRPVLMVPGLGSLNAISVQALNIFAYVAKTAARFANPIRLCCGDAAVYTVAQEIIRDTYQQEGLIDRYDLDSVRFVSDRQFAFAAGVSGTILREQTAAAFFMGEFFAESLIFAETANSVGAIQVASSTQITQTPFFIAACDYVLIGDEFYAASAYLTRQPVLVGSLVGQDWSKILVLTTILVGFVMCSAQMGIFHQSMMDKEKKASLQTVGASQIMQVTYEPVKDKVYGAERPVKRTDSFVYQLIKPTSLPDDLEEKIDRQEDPVSKEVARIKGGGK